MDSWARWTGIILVAAALLRAALLVSHDPLAGYANVGAMDGTSACIGLYPAREAAARAPTPDAPIATYRAGARAAGCYWSAETAFDGMVVAVARTLRADMEHFPLRWIGYAKLALLFATAFTVAALLMDRPAAGVAHGLVVLLVLADPVVTLWMNTLYREFLGIWAVYAALCAAAVLACTDRQAVAWLLLTLALAVLAFAREHDAVLGIVIVALAWPWLWHRSPRMAAATALLSLIAWVAAFVLLQREGVPQSPGHVTLTSLVQAVAGLQHASPSGAGVLEGVRGAKLADLPPSAFSLLDLATRAMPKPVFVALQAATFLLLPLAVLVLLALRRWRGDPFAPLLVAAVLGATAIHGLLAALFGGARDPAARYLLAILAMYAAMAAGAVGLPALARRWIAERRDIPLELGVGAVAASLGVYACVTLISS